MKRFSLILDACLRISVAGIFWIVVRVFHVVKIRGLENDTGAQPAYFAMQHKRDGDPIVELASVVGHRGWRALARDVRFAMRSDVFYPGFLSRVVHRPRWLSSVLGLIPLKTILLHIGIRPLENIHLRPAEVWIRDGLRILGDVRVGDALSLPFIQQVAATSGEAWQKIQSYPLSRLLAWRYREALQVLCSADMFIEPARRMVKQEVVRKFKEQLADLVRWLERGKSLWGSPEGLLSPDGTILPVSAAMHRLIQASPAETCIIPISIIYDFMTTRRSRIFVALTAPIERAALLAPRELEARLRNAWLWHACFTCTQLASGFIVQTIKAGQRTFTLDEMTRAIVQQAALLFEAGRWVDRQLLSTRTARRRAASFLKYALREKLVRRIGRSTWIAVPSSLSIQVRPGEAGYERYPLAYAWNELQEMLAITESDLTIASRA
jgi:1-acyl-sn-glycerol-3-phosphate acyltransferase